MKILILGGNGMLGHNFFNAWKNQYEVSVTLRRDSDCYKTYEYSSNNCYFNVDINKDNIIKDVIDDYRPDFVINCIGTTKQLITEISDYKYINSVFPHMLKDICHKYNTKLILLSSDCVFSGSEGYYSEVRLPDAIDEYGKSKILGEVLDHKNTLTFRKSTIGLELGKNHGLLEWYLTQDKEIKGFKNAVFSGLTTKELANAVELSMIKFPSMYGLFNIAGESISKYRLLKKINNLLKKNLVITPEYDFKCDRSLDGSKFRNYTGYNPPTWDDMLVNLVNEIKERDDI
jgi:dTDP-4-dehydrorhamnose reductase